MVDELSIAAEVEERGFCVIPGVLQGEALVEAQGALQEAIEISRQRGLITFDPRLDPNAHNIRLNNLPHLHPLFIDLVRHPRTLPVAKRILGEDVILSNFTGNIAYPGAGSMNLHSDQGLIAPAPWTAPWALNLIWCLDDVREENGSTLYLPDSHRLQHKADVPTDLEGRLRAFEASAGSVIAMDGRLWHTSGLNVTSDERRAQLFAFYSRSFLRQQVNWEAVLSPETKDGFDDPTKAMFGIGVLSNAFGADLVMKDGYSVGSVDVYHAQA